MIRYNLYRYWWMVFPWKGFSIATFDCGRVLGIHFQEHKHFPQPGKPSWVFRKIEIRLTTSFLRWQRHPPCFGQKPRDHQSSRFFFLQKPFHDFDRAKVQSQRHRFRIVSHGQLLGTSLADAGGCWSSKRVPEVCCILQLFFNKPIKNYV